MYIYISIMYYDFERNPYNFVCKTVKLRKTSKEKFASFYIMIFYKVLRVCDARDQSEFLIRERY